MRNFFKLSKRKAGFTLIELIIVIAVIALLAASVFVAVDPAKRIGEAQNAQRWSDVTAIADAIMKYIVDNTGTFPTSTTSFTAGSNYAIMSNGAIALTSATCTNASVDSTQGVLLTNISGTYLPSMPVDAAGTTDSGKGTGYFFDRKSTGRVTVGACTTYNSASIYVQR